MFYILNNETGRVKRIEHWPEYISPLGASDTWKGTIVVADDDYDRIQSHVVSPEVSYGTLLSFLKMNNTDPSFDIIYALRDIMKDDWSAALRSRRVSDMFFFDEEDRWPSKEDVLIHMLMNDTCVFS